MVPYLAQLANLLDFELKINLGPFLMTKFSIAFVISQWAVGVVSGEAEEALGAGRRDTVGVGRRVQRIALLSRATSRVL